MADPRAARFIAQVPRWLLRSLSPDQAGEAIARGIERRSARIIAPKGWAFMRATRGISDALADRYLLRNREVMTMLAEAEQEGETRTDQTGGPGA
jgi:hypothetical protein